MDELVFNRSLWGDGQGDLILFDGPYPEQVVSGETDLPDVRPNWDRAPSAGEGRRGGQRVPSLLGCPLLFR